MAKEPKLTNWMKGPPARVGEYNASTTRDRNVLRWWDGKQWSTPYWPSWPENQQKQRRRIPTVTHHATIEYRGMVNKPHYPFPPGPLEKM